MYVSYSQKTKYKATVYYDSTINKNTNIYIYFILKKYIISCNNNYNYE